MSLSPTSSQDKKVILLIEDNVDDERLTLRALRKNNIMNEVVVAYDGQEAVDYLFGSPAQPAQAEPAFVILDLGIPKVSGLDVLREIRSHDVTRRLPVVVLTSSTDHEDVRTAYRSGANSFIRKPTDPREFSETILQVALYWLLLNQSAVDRRYA